MINTAEYNKIQKTPLDAMKWKGGFWGSRFEKCGDLMLSNLEGALLNEENSACLKNFARAAGQESGGHVGTQWSDGDCYKWIQAAAHVYAVNKDAGLDEKMDGYISDIAAAQDSDGYINTFNQLNKKERWSWYRDHEIYNFGHLFTAGAVHFTATGKRNFLDIAVKAADYIYSVFQPRPKDKAHFGFNPSNIMGLVDLYRVTGDKRYLELARIFIDMRGSGEGGDDLNQNRTPFLEETEAVGHAVLANYLYSGAVDVFAHTGEEALKDALDRIYDSAVNRKMYITGAQGSYYHGMSSSLDPVEEAFGHDYELPNRVAYTETCANIANAMFNYRLLNVTGDAKYADLMETVMYNSGLSGANVDGTRFYYNNPLSRRDNGIIDLGGTNITDNSAEERWLIHQCYCCPTSYVRTVAQVHEWAFGQAGDSLWMHLYGSGEFSTELDSGTFSLSVKTDYPWDGRISITVNKAPAKECTLNLRIPSWCKAPKVTFRAEIPDVDGPGYLAVSAAFAAGDQVEIDLPMPVRFMRSHYLAEEARGMTAVMRGPVVYCLESCDIEGEVSIDNIYLQRSAEYVPEYRADYLAGLTVLRTRACYLEGGRCEDLYSEMPQMSDELVDITLIPYYAWSNRGSHDMSVWLPVI